MIPFTFQSGLGIEGQAGEMLETHQRQTITPRFDSDCGLGEKLIQSPALYPIALDRVSDTVALVPMTAESYSAAGFLDARILTAGTAAIRCPWSEVRRAAAHLPVRCHFIFHISHVGSTLLSRLLGYRSPLFSLREPAVLRDLARLHERCHEPDSTQIRAEFDERLRVFLALWSRTYSTDQTALIKATSFVGEMADLLMQRVAESRSILMFISPRSFLKTMLGGAMSDIAGQAASRLGRLHRRLGGTIWQLDSMSDGQRIAMSWLSEMLSLRAAAAQFPDRIRWIDFDYFLESPAVELCRAFQHLGVSNSEAAAELALAQPIINQYAKAPKMPFNAQIREGLFRQTELRHAEEIRNGLAWLDRAAVLAPQIANVLEIASAVRQNRS